MTGGAVRKDRTKAMFAAEIESMVETSPLVGISVKDLCERCGVPRQTFYYHFHDKYELVAWIFFQDLMSSGSLAEGAEGGLEEHLSEILGKLWQRKTFYRRAFDGAWEVSILRYVYEFDVGYALEAIEASEGAGVVNEEVRFNVSFAAYGCMTMCIEWLNGRLDLTVDEMSRRLASCIVRLAGSSTRF